MDDLKGKVALVTGASRGIGKAVAIALAEAGLDIAVHYLEKRSDAGALCGRIRKTGRRCAPVQADVSKTEEIHRLVDTVQNELGTIQVLVNNAGVVHRDRLENMTEADWDRVMTINLKAAFLLTQACLEGMRRQKWGRIVNISSVAAQTGGVTGPIYVASKAGLIGLAHSYAAMLVKEGITANAVAPALIETDMVRELGVSPDPIPVGRFGRVEEVADVVAMLVKNAYITGQTINVNGGWYYS